MAVPTLPEASPEQPSEVVPERPLAAVRGALAEAGVGFGCMRRQAPKRTQSSAVYVS